MKKRERMDIISDIIYIIRKKRNIKPTKLLHESNVSPRAFKEYINELIAKKLIIVEVNGKSKTFSVTPMGNDFFEKYKTMKKFIDSFGLE